MSIKYSVAFLALSAALIIAGVKLGWGNWFAAALLFYFACSFLTVGLAYGSLGPSSFGKRANGRHHWLAWFILAPYRGLSHLAFALYRATSKQEAFALAAPNVFFGRRLTSFESLHASRLGWIAVLDLACEFAETKSLRQLQGYRSLPLLDAMAPKREELQRAVDHIREVVASGPIYVHCALGHGRTGSVVIAYLLSEGRVATVAEGIAYLKSLRSGVELNAAQRRVLQTFERPAGIASGRQ